MKSCDFCGYMPDGNNDGVSLYKFPSEEELYRRWIVNMGMEAEWDSSKSSSLCLCSAHFTPDCFESGSARLHPHAIPTVFSPQANILTDTENVPSHQAASNERTASTRSCCGDCSKRLQATERNYQQKLAAAQLQIKEYKKNLAEESRKATQWQKRAVILQGAIRAMKQRGSIPASRKTSTPKTKHLD